MGLDREEPGDWNTCLQLVGQRRDREAFTRLFAHFAPLLKGFLQKGGADAFAAEELVQDTMVKVWRKAPTYSRAQAAASTWIYTIARNTRIDALRRQGRVTFTELPADDLYGEPEIDTPYRSLTQVRNQRNIADHLSRLPRDQAQVIAMMYFEGKSGQEVATELAIPLGTVKSRIRLALKKMRLVFDNAEES